MWAFLMGIPSPPYRHSLRSCLFSLYVIMDICIVFDASEYLCSRSCEPTDV